MVDTGLDAAFGSFVDPANHTMPNDIVPLLLATMLSRDFCGDAERFDDALGECVCMDGRVCAISCGYDVTTDLIGLTVFVCLMIVLLVAQLYSIPKHIAEIRRGAAMTTAATQHQQK